MIVTTTPQWISRYAGAIMVSCTLITTAIGIVHAGDNTATGLDAWTADVVDFSRGQHDALVRTMLLPTEPYVLIPVLVATAAHCALRRSWPGLALVGISPVLLVIVNATILKPLFGRQLAENFVYPSGHTVSLFSTVVVLALIFRSINITIVLAIGTILFSMTAVAMVALRYHYLTDVFGGASFAIAGTLAVAMVIEHMATRIGRRSN